MIDAFCLGCCGGYNMVDLSNLYSQYYSPQLPNNTNHIKKNTPLYSRIIKAIKNFFLRLTSDVQLTKSLPHQTFKSEIRKLLNECQDKINSLHEKGQNQTSRQEIGNQLPGKLTTIWTKIFTTYFHNSFISRNAIDLQNLQKIKNIYLSAIIDHPSPLSLGYLYYLYIGLQTYIKNTCKASPLKYRETNEYALCYHLQRGIEAHIRSQYTAASEALAKDRLANQVEYKFEWDAEQLASTTKQLAPTLEDKSIYNIQQSILSLFNLSSSELSLTRDDDELTFYQMHCLLKDSSQPRSSEAVAHCSKLLKNIRNEFINDILRNLDLSIDLNSSDAEVTPCTLEQRALTHIAEEWQKLKSEDKKKKYDAFLLMQSLPLSNPNEKGSIEAIKELDTLLLKGRNDTFTKIAALRTSMFYVFLEQEFYTQQAQQWFLSSNELDNTALTSMDLILLFQLLYQSAFGSMLQTNCMLEARADIESFRRAGYRIAIDESDPDYNMLLFQDLSIKNAAKTNKIQLYYDKEKNPILTLILEHQNGSKLLLDNFNSKFGSIGNKTGVQINRFNGKLVVNITFSAEIIKSYTERSDSNFKRTESLLKEAVQKVVVAYTAQDQKS